jgi:hypothetical protein
LDWRWQIAQAAMEIAGRIPLSQIRDADARALLQHLQRRQKSPLKEGDKPTTFDRVIGWKETGSGTLIEAFLLAADSYESVAGELGLSAEEVRLYARLYCDLHDEQGKRRPAVLMRLQGELEGQDNADMAVRLKKIALAGGVHGLRRVLRAAMPAKEPSLDELVEAELTRRLHAGELRTGDLVRLQSNAITRQKIMLENKDEGPPKLAESLELVRCVLGLSAPTIVKPDRTQDQVAATNDSIKSRLAAQQQINTTPLRDEPDQGYQALTELVSKQFKAEEGE